MFEYKLTEEVISKYMDGRETAIEHIRIINHLKHDPHTFSELFHSLEIHDMALVCNINNNIVETEPGNRQIINRAKAEQLILRRFGFHIPFRLLLADIRRQNPVEINLIGHISEQYGLRVTRKNPAILKDLISFNRAHKEIIIGIDSKEIKSKIFYNNNFHTFDRNNICLSGELSCRSGVRSCPILIEKDTGQICESCPIDQFFNTWPESIPFSLTIIEKN